MKYCPKCGTELTDESAYCPKCGAYQYADPQQSTQYNQSQQKPPYTKGVTTVNKVFLVLRCAQVLLTIFLAIFFTSSISNYEEMYHSMVAAGVTFSPDTPETALTFFVIFSIYFWFVSVAAAWIVPMTINYFKKSKANVPTTLTFKICTMIFVNFIAGLLMLCCEKNANNSANDNEQFRDRI